jgi:hypothetical protein
MNVIYGAATLLDFGTTADIIVWRVACGVWVWVVATRRQKVESN